MWACLCVGAQFTHMLTRGEPEDDVRFLRSSHFFLFLETGYFIGLEPTGMLDCLGRGRQGPALPCPSVLRSQTSVHVD